MDCDKFVEEKLEERESSEFLIHLRGCPGYRNDVEELRDVRRLYHDASEERYRGRVPSVPSRWSAGAWLPAAVAAVVLIGLLAMILMEPEEKPEEGASDPTVFIRMEVATWGGEEELAFQMDSAWEDLERLEEMTW